MPAKLKVDTEFVKWRVRSDDLELLRILFPDNVNGVVRDVLHAYANHLRAKHFPKS